MKEYHAICEAGVLAIQEKMRQSPERVYAFAIHGTPGTPGKIVALRESEGHPEAPQGFTAIPTRWESTPYRDHYRALYDACRRVPFWAS